MPDLATIDAATPKCPVGPNRPGLREEPEPCGRALFFDHKDGGYWICPAHGDVTTQESLVQRQKVLPERSPYRHYRSDGWPYCPCCDEDELWSGACIPTIDTIVGCYSCSWAP